MIISDIIEYDQAVYTGGHVTRALFVFIHLYRHTWLVVLNPVGDMSDCRIHGS